jgi:predicted glycoside hydrolase/deacetylase ChbG (UPF0249 family)
MKSLIVNADDLGATSGINRGVVETHENGILTSASLMVDAPASVDAARLCARHPELGVGLHVVLPLRLDSSRVEQEIETQLERFRELVGMPPSHLDAHHNRHGDERLLPAFRSVAERHELPLRGHCGVHHIAAFWGQWDGETRVEDISPDAFARIVETQLEDGVNELCCHPGYADSELKSSYSVEREAELETLCAPEVAALLNDRAIRLVTFREVPR